MLRHYMKKLCRDKVMNVATLKDKVFGPDRETKSRQVMLYLVNWPDCHKRVQCCDILQVEEKF